MKKCYKLIFLFFLLASSEPTKNYSKHKKFMLNCLEHKLLRKIPENIGEPKISVIIPVYNGEKFIKSALLSVQNQNFDAIEIIIIDDKSTDNSLKIIEEEHKKDKRIKILKNAKNSGTLYTKIRGILNCTSKYFLLLDQDDLFAHKNAFKTLYKNAEKNNADFIHFKFFESPFESLKENTAMVPKKYGEIIYPDNLSLYLKDCKSSTYFWNKFYKTRNVINALKKLDEKYYNTYMIVHEDIILNSLNCRGSSKYYAINSILYWHNTGNKYAVTHNGSPIISQKLSYFYSGLCNLLDITYAIDEGLPGRSNFAIAIGITAWYVRNKKEEFDFYRKDMDANCKNICAVLYGGNKEISYKIKEELLLLCGYKNMEETL